ncbi:DUF488 domain-containing protein [Bacillus sp. FJAT-49711]|uniref:DUF488 domain-containing protein n=1 Tax=Bacillus sp. FJAT-49711 TaxID=2833585 RepID=UPI001BC9B2D8|nr:DUF488 domain-containing protein [Bacillus sp. FJAT-49711]MBS4218564.1 DUF488 domain-containing protein [Bacillus sp. FJAT-49711]
MEVKIKRAYEDASSWDGIRVLVDRIWPRGVSKEQLKIDHWMKEVAPSNELRKWFNHDPEKFDEFKKKYKDELQKNTQLEDLKSLVLEQREMVTLIYGAKDEKHNQAIVLKEMLDQNNVKK